jgi:hypothetical protein
MEKQTKDVVDQQSREEVEGINTYPEEMIKAKDAKINSLISKIELLLDEKNEWDNRALTAEAQFQSIAQELAATKDELKKEQTAKNEWENRALTAEEALEKANSGKWWKMVLPWVGLTMFTVIFSKAVENGSPQTINKITPLFPVDATLFHSYEYAVQVWRLVARIFVG